MNPPSEQLIRDYLNRLSVAARDRLGFSERQSLLDRTRAQIEAECGGLNGGSPVHVQKALAGLGDPIALVELELGQAGGKAGQAGGKGGQAGGKAGQAGGKAGQAGDKAIRVGDKAIGVGNQHDPAVTGNGQGMVVGQMRASEIAKGNEIGNDLPAAGGTNGSEPARVASSVRSVRAGFSAAQRRLRLADSAVARSGTPSASAPSASAPWASAASASAPWASAPSGEAPNRAMPDMVAAPDASGAAEPESESASGGTRRQPRRLAGSTGAGVSVASGLLRGGFTLARTNKVEILAVMLLGIGGAIYPAVWLLGALLALPSKKWDIRDKFLGITLPVVLVIIGTVLILWMGGQHASIGSYAVEAWVGAGRLSRVLALAGAIYLLWGLRRGRRKPKRPPWNVPHRLG